MCTRWLIPRRDSAPASGQPRRPRLPAPRGTSVSPGRPRAACHDCCEGGRRARRGTRDARASPSTARARSAIASAAGCARRARTRMSGPAELCPGNKNTVSAAFGGATHVVIRDRMWVPIWRPWPSWGIPADPSRGKKVFGLRFRLSECVFVLPKAPPEMYS